ncbi:DUF7716 domain-containing protein [Xenorhabdus szentirmaii]|uniref:DUF7716 domain-containing protein n=1 Tax=Xenorhabdus szentirmaii DSM 16338 TaxID=1427518 RepID=W1IUX2_9GAMM|nr:hypothetical protein [Xenorhabdus szentirmaii]PHM35038.1 hypothetical protein Xsze_01488 [Xenorhabdus szentirmaii DSM 16338]PHM43832.1 hypothetical protein Xszus_03639 [Xenorhabdus szentirmaii]CDL82249.1 conserved hypothetical protein [Xenorhabdus szentirmaii DSM 16338]
MLNKNKKYYLADIITDMKNIDARDDGFCLYGANDEKLKKDGNYYIAAFPDVDDNDEEVYPQIVVKNKLHYLYSGQQLADVIDTVLAQKPSATLDDFVMALNDYTENDDFLDF